MRAVAAVIFAFVFATVSQARDVLTSDRAYYVNGSDTTPASCGVAFAETCAAGDDINNDGLSAAAPFQTIQKALNTVSAGVDFGGRNYVYVYVAAGSPIQSDPQINLNQPFVGSNPVSTTFPGGNTCPLRVVGNSTSSDPTTWADVTIESTGGLPTVLVTNSACLSIEGVKVNGNAIGMQTGGSSSIQFGRVTLGAALMAKLFNGNGGSIENYDDFAMEGDTPTPIFCGYNSSTYIIAGSSPYRKITFLSDINGSQFVRSVNASSCRFDANMVFDLNGFDFIGRKYLAQNGGNIDVGGAGLFFLPGTMNGLTQSGGTYDGFDMQVSAGGTGANTLTGILQGHGQSPFTGIPDSSTVGQLLRVTGAATYGWGALNLANANAVTGILPCQNGGTNSNTAQAATWSPTVSAQTPGGTPPTTSVVFATFKTECGKATAQFNISITNQNSGSGYLKVTLPGTIAALNRGNCFGVEGTTGRAVAGTIDGAPAAYMRMNDATTPIITGRSVNATCIYDY